MVDHLCIHMFIAEPDILSIFSADSRIRKTMENQPKNLLYYFIFVFFCCHFSHKKVNVFFLTKTYCRFAQFSMFSINKQVSTKQYFTYFEQFVSLYLLRSWWCRLPQNGFPKKIYRCPVSGERNYGHVFASNVCARVLLPPQFDARPRVKRRRTSRNN